MFYVLYFHLLTSVGVIGQKRLQVYSIMSYQCMSFCRHQKFVTGSVVSWCLKALRSPMEPLALDGSGSCIVDIC